MHADINLTVKPSQIPNSGMGLFTDNDIGEGALIAEYTGEIATWAEVKDDWRNVYIYFISEARVINAKNHPEVYARYANDAEGLTNPKNLRNNSEFKEIEGQIFLRAVRPIAAGEEVFVGYGHDYWETVRKNSS